MSIELLIPVKGLRQCNTVDSLPAVSACNVASQDAQVMAFLQCLSGMLLKSPSLKPHAELVALGFWLRPAQLQQMLAAIQQHMTKPLGLVVHYTPANVDTMFVYSWVCSLLMGNRNIVRLSQQSSDAKQALIDTMADLLARPEWVSIGEANQFIYYDKLEQTVSSQLSICADARVIWGGDDSVRQIRQLPQKPRSRDISFADRYSACVIDGSALNPDNLKSVAQLLWRDLSPYQQQACSSPRILYWLGDGQYRDALLAAVDNEATNAQRPLNQSNEQLVFSQYAQACGEAGQALIHKHICVLPLLGKSQSLEHHPGQYIILLRELASLDELADYVDAKLQTISYHGVAQADWIKFIADPSITGIERVVPLGQALAFEPHWDGYDLLSQLSRIVTIN